MRKLCLDGKWTLKGLDVENNNYDITDGSTFEMEIPGSVQDALIESLVVPDPYYAENELETLFIGRSDWSIFRSFDFAPVSGCRYVLRLEKVDTIAELLINANVKPSLIYNAALCYLRKTI